MQTTGKLRVGVYGASGYAGMDTVDLLLRHPCVEVVFGTSSTYAGQRIPGTSLRYMPHEAVDVSSVAVVFLALPHRVSAQMAAKALAENVRVLDLSADFRLEDPGIYENWYHSAHPHPELLPAPYGLPEIHRPALHDVDLIAVPGCYPTATLLGLYPLLKQRWLDPAAPIIVDAKSGVSGAGREPKANTHFVEVYSNLAPYNAGRAHRHVPEIEQEIRHLDPHAGMLIFTPHLLPVDRGLMSSIYVTLKEGANAAQAHDLYVDTYAGEPLVEVLDGELATLRHVVRTNRCAISLTPVAERYLLITSVIDNLRKGAAGQAVQCFNIMSGFEETTALL